MKGYTDFASGMVMGMELCKRIDLSNTKYMDWAKVEKICLEHPNEEIEAGLREDWNNTSGTIFSKGKWVDGGFLYDQSMWATPIIDINGAEIECWTHTSHDHTGIPEWWGRGKKSIVSGIWTTKNNLKMGGLYSCGYPMPNMCTRKTSKKKSP